MLLLTSPYVCLSVLLKQLENPWTDFHEILYFEVLLKFVDTTQFWLILNNNGHWTKKAYMRFLARKCLGRESPAIWAAT
jgi:hypothetical protein